MEKVVWIFTIGLILFNSCANVELRERALKKSNEIIDHLDSDDVAAHFSNKYFSKEEIKLLVNEMKECDYKNRKGDFINDYYERDLNDDDADKVFFVYEFFLKCDSVRFILKFELKSEPELVGFTAEPIEAKNPMIIDKSKQLLKMK